VKINSSTHGTITKVAEPEDGKHMFFASQCDIHPVPSSLLSTANSSSSSPGRAPIRVTTNQLETTTWAVPMAVGNRL